MNAYLTELEEKLRKEYPYKIELHAHTNPASSCSELCPEEFVERYASLGFSAVCVTNHLARNRGDVGGWLDDYFAAYEFGLKAGVKIILGAELKFPESRNEYLIYGITPDDYEPICQMLDMSYSDFSDIFRCPEHLMIEAHPYRDGLVDVDWSKLDGIEAFNMHPHHNSRVGKTARLANDAHMLITAGTDFHHRTHEGLGAVRSRFIPENSSDIVSLLRSCDYIFELGGTIALP